MLHVLVLGLALHATPARVTPTAARQVAASRVPNGQLKHQELEKEGGRLIYSFEFAVPGKPGIQEVNVDARGGSVVSVEHEED